jgi:hypothetical protein
VAAAAGLLVAVAVGGKIAGAGGLEAYPRLSVAMGPPELTVTAGVLLCAALPFAGAGARLGVAGGAQPDVVRRAPHRGVTRA